MREARMTFGEHLEELRKRIIVSLLYFAVGLTIALVFGKSLMQVTLTPHQRAYRNAQAQRSMTKVRRTIDALVPLTTMEPTRAQLDGQPIIEPGKQINWAVLFAGDVARARLRLELRQPFDDLANRFGAAPSLSAAQRAELSGSLREHGVELSERLIRFLVPELATDPVAGIPKRFVGLHHKLEKLRDEQGGALGTLVGWGEDLDSSLAQLASFNGFLEERRKQVLESPISLTEVEALSRAGSAPGEALLEIHRRLDKIVDDLRSDAPPRILVISYMENFLAHLRVGVIFGLLFSIPFILYELWKFIGAGLYIHEQRYVVTFLPFSLCLFFLGALFGYFVLIPIGLTFLATWGDADVEMGFTMGNYIGLFFTMTLVLGLAFQTPLIMVFLLKIGAVQVEGFRRARKMAILIGVVVSAILTPPDPFTLCLMAGPMVLLYEFGILVCRFLTPRKKEEVT